MNLPQITPTPYEGIVYRNIFTCSPSQHLLDDVCDEKDWGLVDTLIRVTSGVDHQTSQVKRVFQYGSLESDDLLSIFKKENWGRGRFGDGRTYGVWYAAEDEWTSVYEACWVTYQLGRDNVFPQGEVYTVDRRMYDASILTERKVDLIGEMDFYDRLRASEDYSFCQQLGRKVYEEKFEMIRTPSARRKDGICTPLFSPDIIKKNSYLYDLTLHLRPDGLVSVSSAHEGMSLTLRFPI